jgi:hypothetical protein
MLNKAYSQNESYSPAIQKTAPGMVSATADGWSVDTTSASFLGVTGHWVEVTDGIWKLRSEVIGFRGVSGEHSGKNLGQYFVGVCERVGIVNAQRSKVLYVSIILSFSFSDHYQLLTATLDNASNNTATCKTIEAIHSRRKLLPWIASENQLPFVIHFLDPVVILTFFYPL